MTAEPLLRMSDIGKRFGGVTALDSASISVAAGQVYGLIGPNGSGKTTLVNVATGFIRPDRGEVWFDGKRVDRMRSYQIARLGLVRTFQSSLCPARMTVMENMLLAAPGQTGESLLGIVLRYRAMRAEERAAEARALEILKTVNLVAKIDELAGNLSGGQKKLLGLGQALMVGPKLILLDEPVAGVNPVLVEEISAVIRKLCADGQNFLIVEHNMKFIRQTCHRIAVLDTGRVIAEGTPEDVLSREEVLSAYIARRPDSERRQA